MDLEKLLKLLTIGQLAFAEALKIIENQRAQGSKTEEQLLAESEKMTKEALEIINNL